MEHRAAPKRRNLVETRGRILAAAQKTFAQVGYSQAGVRDIAAAAEVSPSLLVRYYGSKQGLFRAALMAAVQREDLFESDKTVFGASMARLLATEDLDVRLPAMIVLSTGDPEAREITAEITERYIIAPLAEWLGPPDAHERAAGIIMLCTGFVLYTRQLPLRRPSPSMIEWVARSLQEIVERTG